MNFPRSSNLNFLLFQDTILHEPCLYPRALVDAKTKSLVSHPETVVLIFQNVVNNMQSVLV